jgi:hypothetical protein
MQAVESAGSMESLKLARRISNVLLAVFMNSPLRRRPSPVKRQKDHTGKPGALRFSGHLIAKIKAIA